MVLVYICNAIFIYSVHCTLCSDEKTTINFVAPYLVVIIDGAQCLLEWLFIYIA